MSPICLGTLEWCVVVDFGKMRGIIKESFQNTKQQDLSDVHKFFFNVQLNVDNYLHHWIYGCEIINMLWTVIIKRPLQIWLRCYVIWYDMIYLTATGFTPGGSSTVQIYTRTIYTEWQKNGNFWKTQQKLK